MILIVVVLLPVGISIIIYLRRFAMPADLESVDVGLFLNHTAECQTYECFQQAITYLDENLLDVMSHIVAAQVRIFHFSFSALAFVPSLSWQTMVVLWFIFRFKKAQTESARCDHGGVACGVALWCLWCCPVVPVVLQMDMEPVVTGVGRTAAFTWLYIFTAIGATLGIVGCVGAKTPEEAVLL
eukprot:COSAG06_NODE_1156_length_10478_cov_5.792177_14_plen_184_part_00